MCVYVIENQLVMCLCDFLGMYRLFKILNFDVIK